MKMNINFKFFKYGTIIFLITVLYCVMPVLSADESPITMVIGHHFQSDIQVSEVQLAMLHFKNLVEDKTNGGMLVEVHPHASLGNEVEMLREVKDGITIHSTTPSSGAFSSFFPSYQAVVYPYLFPDYLTAWTYFDSEFNKNFMEKMRAETGFRYLGTLDDGGGFTSFTNSVRLIKEPKDLVGIRVRTEENPAHVALMEALGATAIPLEWGQVITALATGVADAQFNAPINGTKYKLYEILPYASYTGHIYNTLNWVVNDKWFSGLPENYQEIILRSAREAITIARGYASFLSFNAWEQSTMLFEETYKLNEQEKNEFRKILQPAFRKWFVEDFGGDSDLLDSIIAEVDRIDKSLGGRD